MTRMRAKYEEEVRKALMEKFGYKREEEYIIYINPNNPKQFKTKDGAKLVERIFIGNEDRKTAIFNKLLNLNKINRMENDSVRMIRVSELEKK